MKRLVLLLSIFMPLNLAAECNQNLRVGLILGLSGPQKGWGDSIKNGFELGLEEAGCTSLTRVYEDDQFNNAKTITAFRKLLDRDKVNVVIVGTSAAGNAVAPLAERAGIPLFAWASDPKVSEGRAFAVRTWLRGQDEGRVISEAAHQRGVKRLAAVISPHDYTLSVLEGMKQVKEVEYAIVEEVAPDQVDFRGTLLKIKQANVEGIVPCLIASGATGKFARQARELGLKQPMFGCFTMEFAGEFAASEGALKGAVYEAAAIEDDFQRRYKFRFGEAQTVGGAATHFDLARIIVATKAKGGRELIDEIMNSRIPAVALIGMSPVKTEKDQFFTNTFSIREFQEEGAALEVRRVDGPR